MSGLMGWVAALRRVILTVAAKLAWLPPTLARICVGWLFMNTGWGKLHHLPDLVSFFRQLGIPMPEFRAPLAAGAEFVCGTLILAGLATRLAVVPLIVTMIVAIATARKDDLNGIADLFGFVEYLYILLLIWLGVSGAGPLSLDRLIARRLDSGRT
jgi:putative oxidoreductase